MVKRLLSRYDFYTFTVYKILCNITEIYLFLAVCVCCYLLVAEIPLFALKFKNLSWRDNKVKFTFVLTCIPMIVFLGVGCFAAIIAWYIILSLFTSKRKAR